VGSNLVRGMDLCPRSFVICR